MCELAFIIVNSYSPRLHPLDGQSGDDDNGFARVVCCVCVRVSPFTIQTATTEADNGLMCSLRSYGPELLKHYERGEERNWPNRKGCESNILI